jgi:hypothetical protein
MYFMCQRGAPLILQCAHRIPDLFFLKASGTRVFLYSRVRMVSISDRARRGVNQNLDEVNPEIGYPIRKKVSHFLGLERNCFKLPRPLPLRVVDEQVVRVPDSPKRGRSVAAIRVREKRRPE